MRTLKQIAIIAIVILAVSCKKDNNNPGGSAGQEILTMKVDGVDWVGDDGLFGFSQVSNNSANIGGRKASSDESLLFSGIIVPTTGTYTIEPSAGQVSFLRNGASPPKMYQVRTVYPKSRASITVTRIKSNTTLLNDLEGTFSGVLYASLTDSVVITNGIFKFN